jgi:hypothetical protein
MKGPSMFEKKGSYTPAEAKRAYDQLNHHRAPRWLGEPADPRARRCERRSPRVPRRPQRYAVRKLPVILEVLPRDGAEMEGRRCSTCVSHKYGC